MARYKNRYNFRSRYIYILFGTKGQELKRTTLGFNALCQLASDPNVANVRLLLVKTGEEFDLDPANLPADQTGWVETIQRYRNSPRGRWLMNYRGAEEFSNWAAEQYLLGKKPKTAIDSEQASQARKSIEGRLIQMHRRAQVAEAALAEEKLWRALGRDNSRRLSDMAQENKHLKTLVALMNRLATQGGTGVVYAVRHCQGEIQFFHGLMDAVMFVHREKEWGDLLIYEGGSTYVIHNHYGHASWFEDRIAEAGYFLVWNADKPEPVHPSYPIWRTKAIVTELPKPVPAAAPLAQTIIRQLPMSPRSVRDLIRR